MKTLKKSTLLLSFLLILLLASTSLAKEASNDGQQPIILKTMGSLYFGGTVNTAPNGDTFHGDSGYAQYFIPQNSRTYPIVMWHGNGQSGRSWETTPDGREGFMQILPRHDWSVYIIDQPRRGRAGRTQATFADSNAIPAAARKSDAWETFRIGNWNPPNAPTFFPGVQFAKDAASINQFLSQQTPNTGDEPFPSADHRKFMANTMVELFRQIGPGILITHSHSGQYGWATAMKQPELIKAIVAYEPGGFAFPEDEPLAFADLNNVEIADQLTKFLKSKGLDGRANPHNGPVLNVVPAKKIAPFM